MKLSYLILLIVMNVFWAASISIYNNLSHHLKTGSTVTLRFGMAGLILLPFWKLMKGRSPRGLELAKTALMGIVVFCIGHRLQVYGDELGGAGNSSVLMGTEPVITSIAAAVFLKERISLVSWLGFLLGLVGVAMLNGLADGQFHLAGALASIVFMSSFLSEAFYSIMGKKLIEHAGMLKILTLALLSGTAANLAIDGHQTFMEARSLSPALWWQVAYLASICTAFGYAIWFVVIKETDVNLTAMTIFVQPIAGVAIAYYWLGDKLHWGQFWGCFAILTGLVLGLRGQQKPVEVATQTPNAC